MPSQKWIDKKSAAHFNLVHRPQNDPFIHDDALPSMVLHQVSVPNTRQPGKPKTLEELEQELDLHPERGEIRENEGEAAEHGVYYDDTEYDYMQHLREISDGAGGDVGFVDAMPVKYKRKGKARMMKLEDALRESTLEDARSEDGGVAVSEAGTQASSSRLGEEFLPSSSLRKTTYQDQQDVPDVLAGFQPDMDPRLREVLEALEDEAYVDDEDEEDVFGALVEGGKSDELRLDEFEDMPEFGFEDEEGWESDATEKPPGDRSGPLEPPPTDDPNLPLPADSSTPDAHAAPTPTSSSSPWLAEFSKFKRATKTTPDSLNPAPPAAAAPSSLNTNSTSFKPLKKRKGALTSSSSYSMTSSSLARTEGHRLLDDRFDRMEALYALDEDPDIADADDEDGGVSVAPSTSSQLSKFSDISGASSNAPSLIEAQASGGLRSDFDGMMDEFLSGFPGTKSGKSKRANGGGNRKEVRERRYKNGMQMLDEVRGELGPARLKGKV